MQIHYIYQIVHYRGPVVYTGGGNDVDKSIREHQKNIQEMLERQGLDPATKAKMTEFMKMVGAVLAKINAIPSSGIREMLKNKLDKIMCEAAGGNLQGAMNMLSDLSILTDKCAKLVERILNDIHILKTMPVAGPAGGLLKAIANAAIKALNGCTSLNDLEKLCALLDSAVEIGHELQKVKPGSREYNDLMAKLTPILNAVMQMAQGDDQQDQVDGGGTAGMAKDENKVGPTQADRIMDGFQQLNQQTQDAMERQRLDALQAELLQLLVMGTNLVNQPQFEQKINAIMNEAATGSVEAARGMASGLMQETEQAGGLHSHLDRRLGRADAAVKGLRGNAGQVAGSALGKLKLIASHTDDPEQLAELDEAIEMLLKGCHGAGSGSLTRSQGYADLLKLDRKLSKMLPPELAAAEQPPASMGHDVWNSSSPGGSPASMPSPEAGSASANIGVFTNPVLPGGGGTAPLASPGASSGNLGQAAAQDPMMAAYASQSLAELTKLRGTASQCTGEAAKDMEHLLKAATKARGRAADPAGQARLASILAQANQLAQPLPSMSPGSPEEDETRRKIKELIKQMEGGHGPHAEESRRHHRHHHVEEPHKQHHKHQHCPVVEAVFVPPVSADGFKTQPTAMAAAASPGGSSTGSGGDGSGSSSDQPSPGASLDDVVVDKPVAAATA